MHQATRTQECQYGSVRLVLSREYLRQMTLLVPMDTGWWNADCRNMSGPLRQTTSIPGASEHQKVVVERAQNKGFTPPRSYWVDSQNTCFFLRKALNRCPHLKGNPLTLVKDPKPQTSNPQPSARSEYHQLLCMALAQRARNTGSLRPQLLGSRVEGWGLG